MPIWVLEIPCVASPESILCWFYYSCTCFFCKLHDLIDFWLIHDIMPESHFCRRDVCERDTRIMCDTFSRPEGELQTILHIEKCNCSVLKLFSGNSCGRKTESITIKCEWFLEICYAEGDDGDSWFHNYLFFTYDIPKSLFRTIAHIFFRLADFDAFYESKIPKIFLYRESIIKI